MTTKEPTCQLCGTLGHYAWTDDKCIRSLAKRLTSVEAQLKNINDDEKCGFQFRPDALPCVLDTGHSGFHENSFTPKKPDQPPEEEILKCPNCQFWCYLSESAWSHMMDTGHDSPNVQDSDPAHDVCDERCVGSCKWHNLRHTLNLCDSVNKPIGRSGWRCDGSGPAHQPTRQCCCDIGGHTGGAAYNCALPEHRAEAAMFYASGHQTAPAATDSLEFKECLTCSSKSGTPALCEICLHNRSLVNRLKQDSLDIVVALQETIEWGTLPPSLKTHISTLLASLKTQ